MRIFVLWIILNTLFFPAMSWSQVSNTAKTQRLNDLQQRIKDLEKQQKEMDDWYNSFFVLGQKRVSPFLNEKISLGGYFEAGIVHIYGPDMKTQTSPNNQALGLNLTAEFNEKVRFVTQTLTVTGTPLNNLHNNPNLTPSTRQYAGYVFGSFTAQGYLEYSANEFFNIQSGLGYIPFGIAYQQREPVLFHQRGGPQIILNDDGTNINIASALWMGLHIYGLLPIEKEEIGYNLYTFTPGSNVQTMGVGGRLWWAVSEFLKTGLSFQYGERKQSSYLAQGIDLDLKYDDFGLLSEYAVVANSGQDLDSETYYIEPYYKFFDDQWLVFVDLEYLRLPSRIDPVTQIPDPIEKKYYGTGVNWLPLPAIRFRLCYLKHDYINDTDRIGGQRRDYDHIEFSTAIAF